MQIFIDSADIEEIKDAAAMGLVDGVTTNPTLIARSGRKLEEVIHDIVEIVDGPISAEVISTECDAILEEGRKLAKIHENIVVKVPLIAEGLKAVQAEEKEDGKNPKASAKLRKQVGRGAGHSVALC